MGSFFDISFTTLNLFSFVLGALWAVSESVGFFGKRNVWLSIVFYFACLAVYYYLKHQGTL